MASKRLSCRRYRCRFCGLRLPALPVTGEPNSALLYGHLSQSHQDRIGPYRQRLRDTTEDIATVAAEAFEVMEDQ
jgi:hypothetical protein